MQPICWTTIVLVWYFLAALYMNVSGVAQRMHKGMTTESEDLEACSSGEATFVVFAVWLASPVFACVHIPLRFIFGWRR